MEILAYTGEAERYCVPCVDKMTPEEREGLTPEYRAEDLRTDEGYPDSCGACLGWVADVNEAFRRHPLADDIMALSIACGDEALTRALSAARAIALDHETTPKRLMKEMQRWAGETTTAHDAFGDTVAEVLSLTARWCDVWKNREIVQLHTTDDGGFVDNMGDAYRYQNTFGYLDVLETECDGCGRCLFNEGYFSDFDTRCAGCVDIVD